MTKQEVTLIGQQIALTEQQIKFHLARGADALIDMWRTAAPAQRGEIEDLFQKLTEKSLQTEVEQRIIQTLAGNCQWCGGDDLSRGKVSHLKHGPV
jgi:hypothetical protein